MDYINIYNTNNINNMYSYSTLKYDIIKYHIPGNNILTNIWSIIFVFYLVYNSLKFFNYIFRLQILFLITFSVKSINFCLLFYIFFRVSGLGF
jgi:hypothetical protein